MGCRLAALVLALFVAFTSSGRCEPLNIHVKLAWTDQKCVGCGMVAMRLIVDGDRIFAFSVMLQDYRDLVTKSQRAIMLEPSGGLKCANHTADRSAPDPRMWGVNVEVCVRLVQRSSRTFVVQYIQRMRSPAPNSRLTLTVDATFNVDVLTSTACRSKLLSARTTYGDGSVYPPTAMREQSCNFVVGD